MSRVSFGAMLAIGLLLAGCAHQVRIAELKDQPTKYNDKTVRITGSVTKSFGIPLVPFQLYNVDDGSARSGTDLMTEPLPTPSHRGI